MEVSPKGLMMLSLVLVLILMLPVLIGIYVYRDAKRRGMNAVLWTLVAILAPLLVGFIVYLLVRGGYSDLECPRCGARVTEQFVVCPQCGGKLRRMCLSCSAPAEPDWKVCPHCAAPLDGAGEGVTPPVRRRDTGLGKVLVLVIVVPVLLVGLAIAGYVIQPQTGSGSLQEVTFEEYLQLQQSGTAQEEVREWLDEVSGRPADKAYILMFERFNELDAGNYFYLLIYVPGAGRQDSMGFGIAPGPFNPILKLDLKRTGGEDTLLCAKLRAEGMHAFVYRFTLDGRALGTEVRRVDYNPTTFYFVPDYAEVGPGDDVFLPDRVSVVKYVNNENVGVAEVTDKDAVRKLLSAIDSGERVPAGEGPSYHFRDGFQIVVEYQVREELVMHEDMVFHMVFIDDGVCWLHDNRVRSTAYGDPFRVMDGDFYELLEGLFEGN